MHYAATQSSCFLRLWMMPNTMRARPMKTDAPTHSETIKGPEFTSTVTLASRRKMLQPFALPGSTHVMSEIMPVGSFVKGLLVLDAISARSGWYCFGTGKPRFCKTVIVILFLIASLRILIGGKYPPGSLRFFALSLRRSNLG